MDKYKKLASNTLIFAIGTFSSKILSFLLMPFVTRMMGTGDYGSADLVQQTVNVLIPVVTLQVNSAALRFALDKAVDKSDVFKVGVRTTLAGFSVFLLFTYPLSKLTINDFHHKIIVGISGTQYLSICDVMLLSLSLLKFIYLYNLAVTK